MITAVLYIFATSIFVLFGYTDIFLVGFLLLFWKNKLQFNSFWKYIVGVLLLSIFIPHGVGVYTSVLLFLFLLFKSLQTFTEKFGIVGAIVLTIIFTYLFKILETILLQIANHLTPITLNFHTLTMQSIQAIIFAFVIYLVLYFFTNTAKKKFQ